MVQEAAQTAAALGGGPASPPRILVVGLGSPHGDDQLGWIVVERLGPRLPHGVAWARAGAALELLELLECKDEVVIVDAAQPAGQPGSIRSFRWPCDSLRQGHAPSTHSLGLADALRLAELLGQLPRKVVIFAAEAQNVEPGAGLSPAVAGSVSALVSAILAEVGAIRQGADPVRHDPP
jgi:hydrogenase maturation protease